MNLPKTILFCWELGGGLGHLIQMLPLASDLARGGHRVYVAFRELHRASELYGKAGVRFLQAPFWSSGGRRYRKPLTYAQMLANVGFGGEHSLFARACAWRNLFQFVRPDLVVFDHAPTALLASRGFPCRRALIGSGFCCPPDEPGDGAGARWGVLRPDAVTAAARGADAAVLDAAAEDVRARVNRLLAHWKQPPVDRLGRLYSEVDENFLTTFPELDHFRDRAGTAYWGPVIAPAGPGAEAPAWPDAAGKKVFVYLKRTPVAGEVLRALGALRVPTLAYVDGLDPAERGRLSSPTLRVAGRRVDVAAASRACDLAVVNGGHGVVAEMLLAGKPVLAVPLVLEQGMTGEALRRLGAGDAAPARRGEPWEWAGGPKLRAVLDDEAYGRCARRFAERYAAFDPLVQRRAMLRRAEELLAEPAAGVGAPELEVATV